METTNEKKLSGDAVNKLFMSLLFKDDDPNEVKDGKPVVEPKIGIGLSVKGFGFFPTRIEEKKQEIKEMLLQLPAEFMESGGGGWTFLNACVTKDGEQWTGFHERMEQLFAMGNALDLCEYQGPREFWQLMPGGMPYVVVKDKN